MRLLQVEVDGMSSREGRLSFVFNDDLNILTGRNGSGKTSILKLVWYIISGNIQIAMREVAFSRVKLETSDYTIIIYKLSDSNIRIELNIDGKEFEFEDNFDEDDGEFTTAEEAGNRKVLEFGASVFFPTFRRIEGGFTLSQRQNVNALGRTLRSKNEVEEGLISLSRQLTNDSHVFVAAMSTVDIVGILLRRYTELSEEYNTVQREISQDIIDSIKAFRSDADTRNDAPTPDSVLSDIQFRIEGMENKRAEIMSPINAIQALVEKLFKHSGIKFGARLSFGDAAAAVSSDVLSAGEKQMLSFICYNALYRDAVIFIDEPELSLHVDWQRQLFGILQNQQSQNQFVIATHSPFIYSKFPSKEIEIGDDKDLHEAAASV